MDGRGAQGTDEDRGTVRDDGGATLIEVVVSIALLAVIVTPAARLVIETGAGANQDRLRVEATDLATSLLENVQNAASFGVIDPGTVGPVTCPDGTKGNDVSLTENGASRVETFCESVTYNFATATNQTVCQAANGGGQVGAQIWVATASVSWKNDGAPVTQTTYLAPEQAGAVPSTSGEIAVPVDNYLETGVPYTASAVPVTVVGSWEGQGSAPSVPSGDFTTESGDTGSTGCATFPNLDPDAGWVYTVYLAGSSAVPSNCAAEQTAVVTSQELPGVVNGSTATVCAPPSVTIASVTIGSPVVTAPFYVDAGDNVAVSYQTQGGGALTAIPAAAELPATVQANPQLLGTNSTFVFDTAGTASISSMTLFPYNDYFLWSGDTVDSNPLYAPSGTPVYTTPTITTLVANEAETGLSVTLPVYATEFSSPIVTGGAELTATEVSAPHETFDLGNFSTGALEVSKTGLPLGQYSLGATVGSITPAYDIWVTPTAVYYGLTAESVPTGYLTSQPTGTPIVLASVS